MTHFFNRNSFRVVHSYYGEITETLLCHNGSCTDLDPLHQAEGAFSFNCDSSVTLSAMDLQNLFTGGTGEARSCASVALV